MTSRTCRGSAQVDLIGKKQGALVPARTKRFSNLGRFETRCAVADRQKSYAKYFSHTVGEGTLSGFGRVGQIKRRPRADACRLAGFALALGHHRLCDGRHGASGALRLSGLDAHAALRAVRLHPLRQSRHGARMHHRHDQPQGLWAKIAGYVITIYGLIYTIMCSWKLIGIHDAVHSDDPMAMFGMQGCSTEPHFPFGLPLEKWAPAWFQPTGDCGYDAPVVPDGAMLSSLQQWFIELYQSSDGWYLIPAWKFMDMASCCLLACIVAAIFLIGMLTGTFARLKKPAGDR